MGTTSASSLCEGDKYLPVIDTLLDRVALSSTTSCLELSLLLHVYVILGWIIELVWERPLSLSHLPISPLNPVLLASWGSNFWVVVVVFDCPEAMNSGVVTVLLKSLETLLTDSPPRPFTVSVRFLNLFKNIWLGSHMDHFSGCVWIVGKYLLASSSLTFASSSLLRGYLGKLDTSKGSGSVVKN